MSKTLYKQKMVRQNNRNGLRERFGYGSLDTRLNSMLPLEWIHTPDKTMPGPYASTSIYSDNLQIALTYSDQISLKNLAAPNNPNFLWSCGATPSPLCGRSVATFTNNVGDYIYANDEGKWRILDSQGNTSTAQLNYGDTIMLQNTIDNFILETCGQSDCNNGHELYSVSTHATVTSNSVQRWKIVSSTGATGAVRNGDDIKLLNLAGYTSYLNTCGVKTGGCGKGQLYGVNTCKLGSYDASHITSEWKISTRGPKQMIRVDDCKTACLADTKCVSFNHNKQTQECLINHGTTGTIADKKFITPTGSTVYYDTKTVGNNGTMPCANYCSSGWNNEAAKGSTCVTARNTKTTEMKDCTSTDSPDGLTCYCKNPVTELISSPGEFDYYKLSKVPYIHTPNKALSSRNFTSVSGRTVDECQDACTNLEMPTDATSCSGWDCTIEGQFCPKGLPGASSYAYTCGYPETSELNDHLTAGNLHWIARGPERPSCKSFDYYKESQGCTLSLQAAGKDGVPALSTYTNNPYDYYERKPNYTREDLNPGYTDWYAMAPISRTWSIHEEKKAMPGINNDAGAVDNISEHKCKEKCEDKMFSDGCKSIEWSPNWNISGGNCRMSSKQAGKNGAPELIDYVDNGTTNSQWNYSEMDEIPVYPEAHPLPDENWWVGSRAPYYNFPTCHIPYGKPCNYGAPKWDPDDKINLKGGECCFGASECKPNILAGHSCNTHDNVWNYAHDIMGTDAEGCDLQPGSQCNYNIGGSGCCKDYTAYGGSNWGCRDEKCTKLDPDGTVSTKTTRQNRPYEK